MTHHYCKRCGREFFPPSACAPCLREASRRDAEEWDRQCEEAERSDYLYDRFPTDRRAA